ncbi:toxin-antitoxin system YwqK family antitoxin [Helicobacter bilis]|uniref:hypothetical protein n=1 Tax=Helicobacter bilis TaxID=37372 RepID=UPI000CF19BD3|nr:hypothetical protein [Helicobacter bilis]
MKKIKNLGVWKTYYKNGNLKAKTPCKDDKAQGIARFYNKNGDMIMKVLYKDDEIQSITCTNGKQFTSKQLARIQHANNHIDEAIQIYNELS